MVVPLNDSGGSYALREDHLHANPPHVPNPPFLRAPAVAVRFNRYNVCFLSNPQFQFRLQNRF